MADLYTPDTFWSLQHTLIHTFKQNNCLLLCRTLHLPTALCRQVAKTHCKHTIAKMASLFCQMSLYFYLLCGSCSADILKIGLKASHICLMNADMMKYWQGICSMSTHVKRFELVEPAFHIHLHLLELWI